MVKENLVIIDYGSGNLRSAAKSFEHVAKTKSHDIKVIISNKPDDIYNADRIVLPGQGAFRDCMENLQSLDGMIEAMEERIINQGIPFLGICVGMQLLATSGTEHGQTHGLNWIKGNVIPIEPKDKTLKIPHMGWNNLCHNPTNDAHNEEHFVLRNIDSDDNVYFVHSYMFDSVYNENILATVNYGRQIPAIIGIDNILGMQFHPEKSHKTGLTLLSRFLDWKP